MNEIMEFEKGKAYFHAAFLDDAFTIPHIETYIYEGFDEQDGHLFWDPQSYLATMSGDNSVHLRQLCFPKGNANEMMDTARLIQWLEKNNVHAGRRV